MARKGSMGRRMSKRSGRRTRRRMSRRMSRKQSRRMSRKQSRKMSRKQRRSMRRRRRKVGGMDPGFGGMTQEERERQVSAMAAIRAQREQEAIQRAMDVSTGSQSPESVTPGQIAEQERALEAIRKEQEERYIRDALAASVGEHPQPQLQPLPASMDPGSGGMTPGDIEEHMAAFEAIRARQEQQEQEDIRAATAASMSVMTPGESEEERRAVIESVDAAYEAGLREDIAREAREEEARIAAAEAPIDEELTPEQKRARQVAAFAGRHIPENIRREGARERVTRHD